MKLKSYPKYKDSGVQWIGEIPEDWKIRKIKDNLRFEIGGTPATGKEEYYDGDNLWVSIADMKNNPLIIETKSMISKEGIINSNVKKIPKGSLLFSFKLSVGYVSFSNVDLYTNEAIASFLQNKKINLNFLKYILKQDFEENGFENIYGAKLFNKDLIGFAKHVVPETYKEQTTIATFLDKKTQKINQTIKKDKKLIELLKEKRIALINHVVTKGLDKNAKMKESGIDWIGEIPEGWEVKKLKFIAKIKTGDKNTEDHLPDGKYPFFVRSQTIERLNTYTFNCEAVLTAGDGVGVGKVFHHYVGKFDAHQRVYVITNFKELLGKYIFYYLKNNLIKEMLKYNAKSTVDSLRLPMFLNFSMTYPKRNEEQTKIVNHLDYHTKKINQTIKKIQEKITLMEEYKKSLINHVVTGKVDVRGFVV
ncbi:MAG: hypothetical protein HF967_05840 [Methanosarcinales archaeon]|nr:hypothetical protein [Methanosarcinales archaeon]